LGCDRIDLLQALIPTAFIITGKPYIIWVIIQSRVLHILCHVIKEEWANKGLDVEVCTANNNREATAIQYFLYDRHGIVAEIAASELDGGIDHAKEMMRNTFLLVQRNLAAAAAGRTLPRGGR